MRIEGNRIWNALIKELCQALTWRWSNQLWKVEFVHKGPNRNLDSGLAPLFFHGNTSKSKKVKIVNHLQLFENVSEEDALHGM